MNVLCIDSLRSDHFVCYNYHRNASPATDVLTVAGIHFENISISYVPCHPPRTSIWSSRHGLHIGRRLS